MSKRPLFTATFWLDALERAIKTAAQTVLGSIGVNVANVTNLKWGEIGVLVAFTTGFSILTSIVSSGIGEPGTASVLNPAPPDTLRDKGLSTIQLIVLVVVVIFAFYGAAHIFGWNLG